MKSLLKPLIIMLALASLALAQKTELSILWMAAGSGDQALFEKYLDKLLAHTCKLDPTRLATIVTVMGGPESWMENCDVVCINRYWGWYVLGGEMDKALVALENELDSTWKIRSKFLRDIKKAYDQDLNLKNLLLTPFFSKQIQASQASWRRVVAKAVELGIPVLAMSSALAFYDSYRHETLPANLL